MSDTRGFELALDKFLARATENAENNMRAIALEALQGVMERTPVDTGFLRANWRIVVNGSPPGRQKAPKGGSRGRRKVSSSYALAQASSLLSVKIGDVITLYNPVEYASHVEYGTSKMAGRHMVRLTLLQLQSKYNINYGRIIT